jgi:hypothetical protein
MLIVRRSNFISAASLLNVCTEQSPNESDGTRCCYKQFDLLKMNTIVFETCTKRLRESSLSLCTEQSPEESDDTRCCTNTI